MIGKSPRPQSRSSGAGRPDRDQQGGSRSSGAGKSRPAPMGGAASGSRHPVDMSGRMDKAPPRRTAKAEIKGYLSKVAREDRETEKSKYKTLDRAMGGADAKAIKEDLRAGREDRMSRSSAPSKSPRPMTRSKSRFKDGGCVMAGRGGKYKGEM